MTEILKLVGALQSPYSRAGVEAVEDLSEEAVEEHPWIERSELEKSIMAIHESADCDALFAGKGDGA